MMMKVYGKKLENAEHLKSISVQIVRGGKFLCQGRVEYLSKQEVRK